MPLFFLTAKVVTFCKTQGWDFTFLLLYPSPLIPEVICSTFSIWNDIQAIFSSNIKMQLQSINSCFLQNKNNTLSRTILHSASGLLPWGDIRGRRCNEIAGDGDGLIGYTTAALLEDFQHIYSQHQRGFIFVCGQHLPVFNHKILPKKVVTSSTSQEVFKIKVPGLWVLRAY